MTVTSFSTYEGEFWRSWATKDGVDPMCLNPFQFASLTVSAKFSLDQMSTSEPMRNVKCDNNCNGNDNVALVVAFVKLALLNCIRKLNKI